MKQNQKHILALFSVTILFLGAGWTWISRAEPGTTTGGNIPAPHRGFISPDFTLNDRQNQSINLSEFRGNAVIINFWATWCPPCRAEMPAIQQVYEDYQAQGLVVLAVNGTYSDSIDNAESFADELGLTFPILFDRDGSAANLYNVRSLPTTYFVDRQGIIQEVVIGGPMTEAMLRIRIEELLQEKRGD